MTSHYTGDLRFQRLSSTVKNEIKLCIYLRELFERFYQKLCSVYISLLWIFILSGIVLIYYFDKFSRYLAFQFIAFWRNFTLP